MSRAGDAEDQVRTSAIEPIDMRNPPAFAVLNPFAGAGTSLAKPTSGYAREDPLGDRRRWPAWLPGGVCRADRRRGGSNGAARVYPCGAYDVSAHASAAGQ